jgi:hypothetical protein
MGEAVTVALRQPSFERVMLVLAATVVVLVGLRLASPVLNPIFCAVVQANPVEERQEVGERSLCTGTLEAKRLQTTELLTRVKQVGGWVNRFLFRKLFARLPCA